MNYEVMAGMLREGICLSIYLSSQSSTRPFIRLSSHPFLHLSVQLRMSLFIVSTSWGEHRPYGPLTRS